MASGSEVRLFSMKAKSAPYPTSEPAVVPPKVWVPITYVGSTTSPLTTDNVKSSGWLLPYVFLTL